MTNVDNALRILEENNVSICFETVKIPVYKGLLTMSSLHVNVYSWLGAYELQVILYTVGYTTESLNFELYLAPF